MKYSTLAKTYKLLESTPKKLEKADILADFYKKCSDNDLCLVVRLSKGKILGSELGIAKQLLKDIIHLSFGIGLEEVNEKFKELGDLGSVAEFFSKNRKQLLLQKKELSVEDVYLTLQKIPFISGSGSVDRKISVVSKLLNNSDSLSVKYLVRTVLGDLRVGVAAGIVRDGIAKAFEKDVKEVERAYNLVGDYGVVAEQAKKGIFNTEVKIGRPIRSMLAERSQGLEEALKKFENPALELKYDGFRLAIHKEDKDVWLYSRRNEDVTKQFPEVIDLVKKNVKAKSCILDGELLAVGKNGKPLPFQKLSRRIKRKYDVEKIAKEIPVQMNFFDIINLEGKNLMDVKLSVRWKKLNKTIKVIKNKFQLAEHLETKDLKKANKFYTYSLNQGQEGLIVKNLDAVYQPGKRVGYWLKVKPILEPLDLVIVGAEWGEGKRANWLGSLVLACKDDGKFLETARMASGLTEEQMKILTKELGSLIISEKGKEVKIKPKIVVEIGYEEIQKSPKYPTGFALRFPRLIRIRDTSDKGPSDVNSLEDIKLFFNQQKKIK